MVDISERGARIQLDNPPGAGASVLLEWLCYDTLCKVAWSTDDTCGLLFDKPLSMARVIELEQYREEFSGPVAEVSNIPLGQKRSRRGG